MRSHSCRSFLVALMVPFNVAAGVLYYPMRVLAAIRQGNRRTRPDAQFQRASRMLPGWNPMRRCILFVLLLLVFAATATSKGFGVVQIYTTSLPKGLVNTTYSA